MKFKQSEELVILLKKEHDAGYNVGYDVGVEEIFFNIWVKPRDINYRFLGGELVKLMDQWLKEERLGTLNTTPPPSPLDQMIKGNIVAADVGPSEVPKQQPLADVKEEVVASNPYSVVEEPANEVTFRFMGNHDLINLEEEEGAPTAVDNNPPT